MKRILILLLIIMGATVMAQTPQIATADPYPTTWRVKFDQTTNDLPGKNQSNVLWESQWLSCPNSAAGQRIRITFLKSNKPYVTDYDGEPTYNGVQYCRVTIGELYFWDANDQPIPLNASNIIAYGTKTNDGSEAGLYDGLNTSESKTTYWQTCTDTNNGDYLTQFPYIEFIIPEGVDVSTFRFGYLTRNQNNVPNPGIFYVSNAVARCYTSCTVNYSTTDPTAATMTFDLGTYADMVYYTINGTDPTTSSTSISGSNATINVTKGDSVRYMLRTGTDTYTPIMTYSFRTSATPHDINLLSGELHFGNADPLYYTLNGDTPTATSSTSNTGIITLADATQLKVFAWNAGKTFRSDIVTMPIGTISNEADFQSMESRGVYQLADDITLSSSTTMANFSGCLDGQNHTISGLSHPLFGVLNGIVRNLTIGRVNLTSSENLGAIANRAIGNARIYNCGLLDPLSTLEGADTVGSLVGVIDGEARVINCYSFANVSGAYTGGIVGYNRGNYTTVRVTVDHYGSNKQVDVATDVTTMVSNCMYYGNAHGTTATSPIYGGNEMINKHIPIYNYYHLDQQTSPITSYGNALVAREEHLTHIEFFRLALNSNREISAYYICGDRTQTQLIDKWVLDKSIAPYPILKPWGYYPSLVNLNPSKVYATQAQDVPVATVNFENLQDTIGKYRRQTIGVLKVNVYSGINGSNPGELAPDREQETHVIYLPITDMDTLNHDFNYYKVQLPYYNDFWTDNYQDAGTDGFGRVVTGWKITAVYGDGDKNTGTYSPTGDNAYNFADRTCWSKDLYETSGRVFAQGGYYNVPDGVNEITIQAYWGRAVYLHDEYEMIYTQRHTSIECHEGWSTNDSITDRAPFALAGPQVSSHQPLFTDLNTAIKAFSPSHNASTGATVYDNAIVLVGNYSHVRYVIWRGDSLGEDVPHTLTSIDQDRDNEPDYSLYFNYQSRNPLNPLRLDFVNNPSFGLIKKQGDSKQLHLLGIPHPRGHFEITETGNGFFNQNEWADCASQNGSTCTRTVHGPLILNGGSTNAVNFNRRNDWHNCIDYVILGGNFYGTIWTPGSHFESQATPSYHSPTSILGAEIDEYYNSGRNEKANNSHIDNIRLYASGGRIGTYAGAFNEPLYGDVTARLDHIVIDTFFGGGTSEAKPIKGNVCNTLSDCIVRFYCGGPKFGNMQSGKAVRNEANHCLFGYYFGAGYGGSALSGRWLVNVANKESAGMTLEFHTDWVTGQFDDSKRLKYESGNKGYMASYHFDWFSYSEAHGTSSCWGIFYNAILSVASVNQVSSTLSDCWVTGDFYGGGSLGKVLSDVTSSLTNCVVDGNAYGGGYSASVPTVEIFDATGYTIPTYNPYTGIYETIGYPPSKTYEWVEGTPVTPSDPTQRTLNANIDFSTLGAVQGSTTLILDDSEVKGSVFGGGNESKVTGNTNVTVKGSTLVKGSVFGGGNKAEVGTDTENTTKVYLLGNCRVDGNVYGGGNQGNTKGNTKVYIGGTD